VKGQRSGAARDDVFGECTINPQEWYELEHAIRAACNVAGLTEIIVILGQEFRSTSSSAGFGIISNPG
jgi:hypothetical protein